MKEYGNRRFYEYPLTVEDLKEAFEKERASLRRQKRAGADV
jgi:hypothetical protein